MTLVAVTLGYQAAAEFAPPGFASPPANVLRDERALAPDIDHHVSAFDGVHEYGASIDARGRWLQSRDTERHRTDANRHRDGIHARRSCFWRRWSGRAISMGDIRERTTRCAGDILHTHIG